MQSPTARCHAVGLLFRFSMPLPPNLEIRWHLQPQSDPLLGHWRLTNRGPPSNEWSRGIPSRVFKEWRQEILQPRQHPHLKSAALDGCCFGAAISAIQSLSLDLAPFLCSMLFLRRIEVQFIGGFGRQKGPSRDRDQKGCSGGTSVML